MDESRRAVRARAIELCRNKGILVPTLAEQRDPGTIDPAVAKAIPRVDMQATDPLNLFRITWKNDPATGGFGPVNVLELPPELTGVHARIVGLVGKHFPTGSHKVGAAFGCLVPRLVRGEFDPTRQIAVWPSTGNYCRGGAFDSALLGCKAIAILPEEMSRERFDWLRAIGAEIVATPGCESNVKEIFDACHEIGRSGRDVVVFNQFDELGNYLWHRGVTGPAAEEALGAILRPPLRLAGWIGATGSAGTLAAGDHLKRAFPGSFVGVSEALQCPTLLWAGFGGHRIEGIGDKHVPWIHNVRNTDLVAGIDDEAPMRLLRLFNEPAGEELLARKGIDSALVEKLPLLGISSLCNLLSAVKAAKLFELDENDVVVTAFTDSAAMYQTRLVELREQLGPYDERAAEIDLERRLWGTATDHVKELGYRERKAIHNLKYFTWVEQQGKAVEELNALWSPRFWEDLVDGLPEWDEAIRAFNEESGALDVVKARPA